MTKRQIIYAVILAFIGAGIIFCLGAIRIGQMMDRDNQQLYAGYADTGQANQQPEDETPASVDAPIHIDWDSLKAKNTDVAGWVYVEADYDNNIISYPVLYKEGDRDYYLRHDINNKYSKYGVPFIPGDYDLTGKVMSIHGHNFGESAKTMFSPLLKYENEEYTKRHPVIWYGKVGEDVQPYTIFAVMRYDCAPLDAGKDVWNYLQTSFASDKEYEEWLAEAKTKSLYDTGLTPSSNAEVVILSTCETAQTTSVRCVVFAYREVM